MRTYWKVLTPLVLSAMALAQGPVTDKVMVTFPNPVVVSGTTLAAGEYMIRQLPSANNPRVLEFSSNDGTRVEVTTTAFPILDNMNRKPTSVILEQRGNTYHVSKIWLAGKNYGYGLPVSEDSAAMAGSADGLRLTASYAPAQAEQTTQTTETTTRTQETTTTVAQSTPPPQPEPAPQQTPQQTEQQTQTQAQATPPEQPAPTPTPAQTEPAPVQPVQTAQTDTPDMPATASHWSLLMLAGGVLALAGLRMRRLTSR